MICRSYRTVCTLPVSTMLRASHSAQDGGDERLQEQAEDDDQDESQCIFHNHELISFSLYSGPSGPGYAYIFLLSESEPCKMKASRRRRIRSRPGGRLSVSPARRSGLTHRWASLDLQERIYANTRGRTSGYTASGQKKKDAPERCIYDTMILWYFGCFGDTMIL